MSIRRFYLTLVWEVLERIALAVLSEGHRLANRIGEERDAYMSLQPILEWIDDVWTFAWYRTRRGFVHRRQYPGDNRLSWAEIRDIPHS